MKIDWFCCIGLCDEIEVAERGHLRGFGVVSAVLFILLDCFLFLSFQGLSMP